MRKEREQQLVDYYSTKDCYVRNKLHSNTDKIVFNKENDKYQWLVLELKSKNQVEVRQTDSHGKIITWDTYDFIGNLPKCISMQRLNKDGYQQIYFNINEINLIHQLKAQEKERISMDLSEIVSQIKDNTIKEIVNIIWKKLNVLSEENYIEFIAVIQKQKIM